MEYTIIASGYGNKEDCTIGYSILQENGSLTQDMVKYSGNKNPSYLAQAHDYLISIEEVSETATVTSWKFDGCYLVPIDKIAVPGTGLCYIDYSERWSMIVGACYETGDVFALRLYEDGSLQLLSVLQQPADREGISRAHCMQFDIQQNYVYGVNIASDQVIVYDVDENGIYEQRPSNSLQLPYGSGARHIIWHPYLPVAYVVTEYSNEIFVLRQDLYNGGVSVIQVVSTIRSIGEETFAATACVNQGGTVLYASNRGANTIVRMSIQRDGTLRYEEETTCYGNWPRDIALTGDDRYLMIANQRSNDVSVVEVDGRTGELGRLVATMEFNEASFVGEWYCRYY